MNTYYCWSADCEGRDGFDVGETRATLTEPAYLLRDTCPHCGAEMFADRPPWGDVITTLVDDLRDHDLVTKAEQDALDHDALAVAIEAEIKRQAARRRRAA